MATIKRVEDIEAWQKARKLTSMIYDCFESGRFARDFGLKDQVRRAAISIMANIAEGFERGGTAEFLHFLAIANGSAGEVQTHLYVARDQGHIKKEEFAKINMFANDTSNLTGGFMTCLKNTKFKGRKYSPGKITRNSEL